MLDHGFAKKKPAKEASMNKSTKLGEFFGERIENADILEKAKKVIPGILPAHAPRQSDMARAMRGSEAGRYKYIPRFLPRSEPGSMLPRWFPENAEFVIGDVTEMLRRQAKKTEYVGKLSDGKTSGYGLLFLAAPYRGRAIPCPLVSYSLQTIQAEASSRNRDPFQALAQIKPLLGDKPLVLDREFSDWERMQALQTEQIHLVIRFKVGANVYVPEGQLVSLSVRKGEPRMIHKVF